MISVLSRKWELNKINKNSLEKIKQDYKLSEIVSKLIISRKFDKTEITSIDNTLKFFDKKNCSASDQTMCERPLPCKNIIVSLFLSNP